MAKKASKGKKKRKRKSRKRKRLPPYEKSQGKKGAVKTCEGIYLCIGSLAALLVVVIWYMIDRWKRKVDWTKSVPSDNSRYNHYQQYTTCFVAPSHQKFWVQPVTVFPFEERKPRYRVTIFNRPLVKTTPSIMIDGILDHKQREH